MSIFRQILKREESRSTLSYPDEALVAALRGATMTAAGVAVTASSAMGYSAVVAATRVLAESVAQLPFLLYERTSDGGRARAMGHPLFSLLHDAPNAVQDAFVFWELAITHLVLWGNFYAEIVVDPTGTIRALWPMDPRYVAIKKRDDGTLAYRYEHPGLPNGPQDMPYIFHVRGMAGDGLKGKSLLGAARGAIGLGLAAEEFGARFFSNGARPGVVLTHPGRLGPEGRKNLRDSWNKAHQGLDNAQRVAVLEEGLQVETIGIPPDDAQFLETRKFQVSEIARIFRVPPHMIGDLERATFSNIEQQSLDFVIHSLGPWLRRIEKAVGIQLLDADERKRYYAEFLVDGLLRGDIKARYEAYAVGRQWGWLSTNDVRRRENMNPVDGGDDYLTPLNMLTREQAAQADGQKEAAPGKRVRELRAAAEEPGDGIPQAAIVRHRLAGAMIGTLESTAQRIINREVNDVRHAARKHLASDEPDVQGFVEWLRWFYGQDEHAAFTARYIEPVLRSYLEMIRGSVADEIGEEPDAEAMGRWLDDYVASRADIWAKEHRWQLTHAAEDEGLDGVDSALEAMKENEAGVWAADQSYRFNNAAAVTGYLLLRRTEKRWVAFGDNCPYCQQLNGRIVGVELEFLAPGDSLEDGEGGSYTTQSHVRHAPLHDGCDCMVISA